MQKKIKVLVFFLVILLILIIYLILTSESAKNLDNFSQQSRNEKMALLESKYQTRVKELFTVYETLAQDNNSAVEKFTELKNQLLILKEVPAKFKELHLNFVSALNSMEDYLKDKNQQGKIKSQQIINQLKADYSWLNN
jgi:hypothetical protein